MTEPKSTVIHFRELHAWLEGIPSTSFQNQRQQLMDKTTTVALRVYAERAGLQNRIAELEARPDSSKQEWILPADRLPALHRSSKNDEVTSDLVLVCLKSGHIRVDQLDALQYSETSWWSQYGSEVRAWMPLPEALK